MDEMLYKFIDEGTCEQEEVRAFINEFRTTNELLFKERNNSLSELRFEVQGLLRVINNTLLSNLEVKGVITRDLGASICLRPYTMYEKLSLGDRSVQNLRGIVENVLIKVDKFVLPKDFIILDMPGDSRVPIILGRPFLATARAMIDVFNKKITLRVGDDEVIFDMDQSIKRSPTKDDECYGIDNIDGVIDEEAQELLANDTSDSFLLKGQEKSNDQSDLESYESFECKAVDDFDSWEPIRRIESVNMPYPEKILLLQVLEKRKGAIDWKMSDVKGISPSYCTHKILMEYDYKPVIQPQRRLNPKVQDVVKNQNVKLLDSGLIYLISDSLWVSPIHVVLNKRGMIVVLNDNNELITSRKVTGWRVFIDYCELNDATRKDHFPLPFIDQMLERLCGNEYYCFLDENLAADHLSRLENPDLGTFTEEEISDKFLDEHLMILKTKLNEYEPSILALKQCNMDLTAAVKNYFMELNELMELRDGAYENTHIYKERTKRWHDSRLHGDKNFKVGDKVFLFNSGFKMHSGKLKSRWYEPNVVKTVYPYGTIEIIDRNRISFKVNRQRLKKYHDGHIDPEDKKVVEFEQDIA
nr:hypothetical protein [Tanacetum cinerariifolium]